MAKRIDLELKGDQVGLLALEHGIDTKRKAGGLNQETELLVNHGRDI